MDALRRVNAAREADGGTPVHKTSVYRYLKGETHRLGRRERRGRDKALTRKDCVKLQQARRRLLKRANSQRRVTDKDIMEEAGTPGEVRDAVGGLNRGSCTSSALGPRA